MACGWRNDRLGIKTGGTIPFTKAPGGAYRRRVAVRAASSEARRLKGDLLALASAAGPQTQLARIPEVGMRARLGQGGWFCGGGLMRERSGVSRSSVELLQVGHRLQALTFGE